MIPLIGLLAGIALGLILEPTVPQALQPYLPIAIVAAMDALFGAFRAYLEGTFSDRVFVVSFISNVLIAAAIVYVGDQIGVGSQLSTGGRRRARHPHLHQCRRHPTGAVPCLTRRSGPADLGVRTTRCLGGWVRCGEASDDRPRPRPRSRRRARRAHGKRRLAAVLRHAGARPGHRRGDPVRRRSGRGDADPHQRGRRHLPHRPPGGPDPAAGRPEHRVPPAGERDRRTGTDPNRAAVRAPTPSGWPAKRPNAGSARCPSWPARPRPPARGSGCGSPTRGPRWMRPCCWTPSRRCATPAPR